jgi:hypothetical protein
MGDNRSGFAAPKAHRPKQSLALAHPQLDAVSLGEVVGEQFAVPEVVPVPKLPGRSPKILLDPCPGPFVQPPRSSRTLSFPQSTETASFKPLYPAFDRCGMLPEPLCDLIAALSMGHEQKAVQSVIVTGFFRAVNLILQRQCHGCGVGDLEAFHAHQSKARSSTVATLLCCITYDVAYSRPPRTTARMMFPIFRMSSLFI